MADRELPELKTRLRLDASDLDRADARLRRFVDSVQSGEGLGRYEQQLKSFADRTDQFADKATRNVTLPIVAAGAASTVLATRFNQSFTQMQSLAGVAADEVAALKGEVLDLSGETARSPQELAEALYFIRSAGLDGSAALDALESSAKGSAIGLGSTVQVADAATSAVNAYGEENLSAAQAVDVLAAAVEQGKGEAADFAPQLGQLLPLATNLGVEFSEVAGSLAFLTQTGAPASQAATQIAGVFQKLIRPTAQGREELEKVGLTVDGLREVVANQGLLPALQLLNDRLGGNQEAFGRIFEDSEGLIGVLALLRDDGTAAADVLADVAASSGMVAEKFGELSETEEFQWQQSLADLQRIGIQVGQDLIPILADLGGAVSGIVDVFTQLPDPIQSGILAMIALAAALGPLAKGLSLGSSAAAGLIRVMQSSRFDSLRSAIGGLAATAQTSASPLGGLATIVAAYPGATAAAVVGIGGLVYALTQVETQAERSAAATKRVADEAQRTGRSAAEVLKEQLANEFAGTEGGVADFAATFGVKADRLQSSLREALVSTDELVAGLFGSEEAYAELIDQVRAGFARKREIYADNQPMLDSLAGQEEVAIAALGKLRGVQVDATAVDERATEVKRAFGVETESAGDAAEGAAGQVADLGDETASTAEDFAQAAQDARALFDAYRASDDATQAVADAQAELAAIQAAARGDSDEYRAAQERIVDAEKAVADAQRESRSAQEDLSRARADATERLEDLQFAAEGAALAEVGAGQALERARQDLLKARTPLDRAEAELRIKQAELALRQAQDATGDTAAELADARAKGVEGSDEVVAAQERITAAREREQDAQGQLSAATDAAAKVIADAQAKIEGATDKVTEAQLDQADASAELAGKTDGAAAANQSLIEGLFILAGQLDPNSPLRKRLLDYIGDLQTLNDTLNGDTPPPAGPPRPDGTVPVIQGSTGGLFGQAADYFDQNGPGRTLTAPSSVPVPGGKSLAPAAVAPAAMPNVEVTVQVTGQPDAAMLAQLERVAASAVERGMRQAVVG